jgi:hypothetical protein
MPRLSRTDDAAQESASRRSSGRARRPTAKIEALAGTKFYPSDSAKTNRFASTSQSPDPSFDSSFSTPISPRSEAAPNGSQDQTSPSTISVQLNSPESTHVGDKQATTVASLHETASTAPLKQSLRRERKPTQRALEMTDMPTKTRRRRRTQAEMAALRVSTTPSEASITSEVQSPVTQRSQHSEQPLEKAPATPVVVPASPVKVRRSRTKPEKVLAEVTDQEKAKPVAVDGSKQLGAEAELKHATAPSSLPRKPGTCHFEI